MAPNLVQSVSATGTSATSLTVTLASTAAGNCLVVCVGMEEGTNNPTVSGVTLGGSAGNFAVANTAYNNSDTNAAIWVDPNCAGGQTSVVISMTGGTGTSPNTAAWVMEWSGLATSSVVDKAPAGANGPGTSWSSGSSGTLSQAVEVAIGNVFALGSLTTPGSPWNELGTLTAGTGFFGTAYQVTAATTALTYNGSCGSSWGTCIVTLLAAATVPPSPHARSSPAAAAARRSPPRGRVSSNKGAPVHNPTFGPVFKQKTFPARARIPQNAPRGRIGSNVGAPVNNPPPPPPPPPGFLYLGQVRLAYLEYLDQDGPGTLVADPGNYYQMILAGCRPGLTIPPSDGRWQGGGGQLQSWVVHHLAHAGYMSMLAAGHAVNAQLQADNAAKPVTYSGDGSHEYGMPEPAPSAGLAQIMPGLAQNADRQARMARGEKVDLKREEYD